MDSAYIQQHFSHIWKISSNLKGVPQFLGETNSAEWLNYLVPPSLSFIRFHWILHDSAVILSYFENFLKLKRGGSNFLGEPIILQNGWLIWSPLLHFSFKKLNDPLFTLWLCSAKQSFTPGNSAKWCSFYTPCGDTLENSKATWKFHLFFGWLLEILLNQPPMFGSANAKKKVFLSLLYTLSCDPHTTISYARRGMHGSYNIPLLPYSIQHSTYKLHDGAGGYVYGTNTFPVKY